MLPKTIRKYLPLRPHSPADSKSLAMKGLQENKNTERKENHACSFVHMLFIIPTAPLCACVCVCAFLSSLAVLLQASGCFSNENNCAKGAGEFIAIKDALVAVLGAEPRQSQYLMQISFNQPSVSSYRSTSSRFSCLFFFLPQLDRIVKRNSPLPIMFGNEAK